MHDVDFRHATGTPETTCQRANADQDYVLGVVDGVLIRYVDPVVCPVLAENSPADDEVIDLVLPDGDVVLVWNCPPY